MNNGIFVTKDEMKAYSKKIEELESRVLQLGVQVGELATQVASSKIA